MRDLTIISEFKKVAAASREQNSNIAKAYFELSILKDLLIQKNLIKQDEIDQLYKEKVDQVVDQIRQSEKNEEPKQEEIKA